MAHKYTDDEMADWLADVSHKAMQEDAEGGVGIAGAILIRMGELEEQM